MVSERTLNTGELYKYWKDSQNPRSASYKLHKFKIQITLHSKKRTTCSGLMKTALNNVLLPTLFKVVNNTEQVDEPELACNQV